MYQKWNMTFSVLSSKRMTMCAEAADYEQQKRAGYFRADVHLPDDESVDEPENTFSSEYISKIIDKLSYRHSA